MGLNQHFWKDKKVFLTGHSGFKGSWMAVWLESMGATVFGYSLAPNTEPNLLQALKLSSKNINDFADIRNFENVKKELLAFSPEIVIHMAAQPLVRDSYDDPMYTYSTNVMGTLNLLEACRKCASVKVILNVTTDKCYKNVNKAEGYIESDPLGGYDPYSSSKACSELVTSSYRDSFFNNENKFVASARAGNVIGGGDWSKDRLIPDLIKAAAAKRTAIIRQPKAIRPWQHVLEPVYGYLLLCQRMWLEGKPFAQEYNFGPDANDAKDVRWIAERISRIWSDAKFDIQENYEKHEAQILKLNCDKAKTQLNWKPKLTTEDAITMTVEWYKNFYEQKIPVKEFTLQQINYYEQKLSL